MVEDAKAARDRRLAEALRANLKRRKAASQRTSTLGPTALGPTTRGEATGAETEAAPPQPTEGDD